MLWQRVVTGTIGAAIALYAIQTGGWLYFGLITILTLLGWREFVRLMSHLHIPIPAVGGYIFLLIIMIFTWWKLYSGLFVVTSTLFVYYLSLLVFCHKKFMPTHLGITLMGLIYLGLGFSTLLALRQDLLGYSLASLFSANTDKSTFFVWLAFLPTWASDTFAYAVGKLFGRRKLCPIISPKKTREGTLGGLIGAIITAVAISFVFHFSLIYGFLAGLVVGCCAPIGDLVESVLKRWCGVKDSGMLLPGHGGVLDRFDSLLLVGPVILSYFIVISW